MVRAFLIIILFSVIVRTTFASDLIEVQELSQGSCWATTDGKVAKVSSFNSAKSFVLTQGSLSNFIEKIEELALDEGRAFSVESLSLGVHCGSYGSSLIFRLSGETPYCLWAQVTEDDVQFSSFMGDKGTGRFCQGYKLGHLLIKARPGSDEMLLESLRSDENVSEVRPLSRSYYVVSLIKQWQGNEAEFQKLLKSNNHVERSELNLYQHPNGEYMELLRR